MSLKSLNPDGYADLEGPLLGSAPQPVQGKPLMERRLDRDFAMVAGIALVTCLLLGWVQNTVGVIAVAGGQGWDGSVFVRVIHEIVTGAYSNSDPYRAIRTVAFPAIYYIEYFRPEANIVNAQRNVNILSMVASICMLYTSARLKSVARSTAVVTVATFFAAWCVLVVPVFTPVLTDHLAIFTSSLSLLLWAADRKRGLYVIVLACVWVMPSAALIPLALLAMKDEPGDTRWPPVPVRINVACLLASLAICAAVYMWKGPALLEGVDTHVFDFPRNPDGELTGSLRLLPVSIIVVIAMVFLCVRSAVLFLTSHIRHVDAKRVVVGLMVALASFAVMRLLIDFDKGFSAGQLFNNMTKQALSAPLKTWAAHAAYFGPAVLVTYYFVAFRRTVLPAPVLLCLVGFMPLLALGSETRQWIAVLPVVMLALCFLPLSMRTRLALMLFSVCMFWGVWTLNDEVTQAVVTNVGLQHPLWNSYMGRVGPWMTMGVYRYWLVLATLMMIALYLVEVLPRRLSRRVRG